MGQDRREAQTPEHGENENCAVRVVEVVVANLKLNSSLR